MVLSENRFPLFGTMRLPRPRATEGDAVEIRHLGGGLFAPLQHRRRLRGGAPARRRRGWRGRSASIPTYGSSRSRIAPGGISSTAMWWLSGFYLQRNAAYFPLVLTCEGCTTRRRSER